MLLVTASAFIWVGTAFAGYAIYLALIPAAPAPWAAAIAGIVLVVGPVVWAILLLVRRKRPPPAPRMHQPDPRMPPAMAGTAEAATLDLLAKIAQDKPLLAVLFAGILGASEAMANRRNQM